MFKKKKIKLHDLYISWLDGMTQTIKDVDYYRTATGNIFLIYPDDKPGPSSTIIGSNAFKTIDIFEVSDE